MENKRLKSLDAFRGFTIAAMILVNYPASWSHVFEPLLHAPWHGLTPTDLIFPFFLYIVGVSIVLAYTKKLHEGADMKSIYKKIIIRSLKIFAVGILLNYIHHFKISEIRIAGVLQRIAIVFLISSFIFLLTSWKTQAWIAAGLLVFYWISMTLFPTPGYDKAMLEPGINLAAWIDSYLLPGKMWQGTWDPEGIFSTLPAIATALLGMLTGKILTSDNTQEKKVINLFIFGFALSLAGYVWSLHFPLNKNIWTSSYVLITAGFASLTLAASVYIVDILGRDKIARIGIIYGANAITVYVLAALFAFIFYYTNWGEHRLSYYFMQMFSEPYLKLGSFIYALLFLAFNFIPVYILYRKKIFIKL